MCFSVEADLVAGATLVPLGVLSLRTATRPREWLLASLPLLFGVHQLVEALVWAGLDGDVSATTAHRAALAYVIFALPVLPSLLPLAVWLAEDRRHRRRVAPFLALGLAVSAAMTHTLVVNGLEVQGFDHAIGYYVGLGPDDWFWTTMYVVACMGACLMSSSGWIRAFGVVNLVGLSIVALAYAEAFASLWCVYAALSSVLILVHLTHVRHDTEREAVPA